MKVSKSVEQGIYVLCILALQKDHTPVKSRTLSGLLEVSDSYLKKLLAKMVKAALITSSANRAGGYRLARPVTEITVYDVFDALEEDKDVLKLGHLGERIFPDKAHARESEARIVAAFDRGFDALYDELKSLKISELLRAEYIETGAIDWEETPQTD